MTPDARLRDLLDDLFAQASARAVTSQAALDALLHDRVGSNDDDEHDPDGVTLSAEWSRLSGLAEAAAAELQQIVDARARFDDGTYGMCATCGQPIPVARLEVRPFAEQCVPCAERT